MILPANSASFELHIQNLNIIIQRANMAIVLDKIFQIDFKTLNCDFAYKRIPNRTEMAQLITSSFFRYIYEQMVCVANPFGAQPNASFNGTVHGVFCLPFSAHLFRFFDF